MTCAGSHQVTVMLSCTCTHGLGSLLEQEGEGWEDRPRERKGQTLRVRGGGETGPAFWWSGPVPWALVVGPEVDFHTANQFLTDQL